MLKSYHRRAFLLLALTALEPTIASAARGDDAPSVWDILTKTNTAAAEVTGAPVASNAGRTNAVVRKPMGPVPGFTLPESGQAVAKKHSGFFGALGDRFARWETLTGTKIKLSGNSDTVLEKSSVSGSASAEQSDEYLGQGTGGFYNNTDVSVDATLFKWFHYTTRFSNSEFSNPNTNQFKLDYHTKSTRVEYGDINVSFQGNSLIDFGRYLQGIQIHDEWTPKFKTTLLYAATKADTVSMVIPGNNSSGPYYVYAGQIVDGSAQVRLDNQLLTSGTDYTLDTFTGQLNFLHNRIVLQSDSIAVSFETLGTNASPGAIYGGRMELLPTKRLDIGLTYVTQTAQGSGANQTRTEQMNGFGAPNFYTTTEPIDLTKPLIISVGGQVLPPTAYIINKTTLYTNQIFIEETILPSQIITIQYVPYDLSPIPGNRSIMGVDAKYTLGKIGSVTLETGLSGLSISNANIDGHAWKLSSDLTPFKNLHTLITLKDISPTFSSIQTPGFNMNEKSIEISTDYNPFKKLKLNLDWELSHRPSYSGTSQFTVNNVGTDHFDQYSAGLTYQLSKTGTLSLTRSDVGTDFALGGNSRTTNNAFTYNTTWKKFSVEASLNDTISNVTSTSALLGLAPTTNTSTLYTSDSSSYGGRIGLHWQASKLLNFTGAISENRIHSTDGTAAGTTGTTASDAQITTAFQGIKYTHLNYSLDYSDTGNDAVSSTPSGVAATPVAAATTPTTPTSTSTNSLVGTSIRSALAEMSRDLSTSGSTSSSSTSSSTSTSTGSLLGGGINNGLGGFGNTNGVIPTSSSYTSFGGRSLTNRLQMDISPRRNMQLGLSLNNASSLGDYQYNSNSTGLSFNFSWQMSEKMQLTANYTIQHLVYTGTFGGSDSSTALFAFQGRPFGGKLGVALSFQSMVTSSAFNNSATSSSSTSSSTALTNTSSDLMSLSLRLDYPIAKRISVFTEILNSTTNGYLGNKENDIRFGLDYALMASLKFSLGWQILSHIYDDPSNASLNYRASNLLAEFGFHF